MEDGKNSIQIELRYKDKHREETFFHQLLEKSFLRIFGTRALGSRIFIGHFHWSSNVSGNVSRNVLSNVWKSSRMLIVLWSMESFRGACAIENWETAESIFVHMCYEIASLWSAEMLRMLAEQDVVMLSLPTDPSWYHLASRFLKHLENFHHESWSRVQSGIVMDPNFNKDHWDLFN